MMQQKQAAAPAAPAAAAKGGTPLTHVTSQVEGRLSELGQRVALDEVSQLHGGGSVEDEPRRAHLVVSC